MTKILYISRLIISSTILFSTLFCPLFSLAGSGEQLQFDFQMETPASTLRNFSTEDQDRMVQQYPQSFSFRKPNKGQHYTRWFSPKNILKIDIETILQENYNNFTTSNGKAKDIILVLINDYFRTELSVFFAKEFKQSSAYPIVGRFELALTTKTKYSKPDGLHELTDSELYDLARKQAKLWIDLLNAELPTDLSFKIKANTNGYGSEYSNASNVLEIKKTIVEITVELKTSSIWSNHNWATILQTSLINFTRQVTPTMGSKISLENNKISCNETI